MAFVEAVTGSIASIKVNRIFHIITFYFNLFSALFQNVIDMGIYLTSFHEVYE